MLNFSTTNLGFALLFLVCIAPLKRTQFLAPISQATFVSRTAVFAEDTVSESPARVERGVSVDQDGKSNVWAIEPKMEVSTKSSEEKTSSALIAGGGLAALVVIAGLVLSNLPDPNQF